MAETLQFKCEKCGRLFEPDLLEAQDNGLASVSRVATRSILVCRTCHENMVENPAISGGQPGNHRGVLASGAIQSDFATSANSRKLAVLIQKYQSLPMSFADACLVRLAEIHDGAALLTVDFHFQVYRKNGSEPLSLMMPE